MQAADTMADNQPGPPDQRVTDPAARPQPLSPVTAPTSKAPAQPTECDLPMRRRRKISDYLNEKLQSSAPEIALSGAEIFLKIARQIERNSRLINELGR